MRPSAPPIHPLLFAAYFVLFLYAQNLGEVQLAEVLPVLLLALGGATLAMALTWLVLRDWRRAAIVASALVICFFAYGHLANALVAWRIPGWVQQLGWIAAIVGAALVAWRIRDRLQALTRGLDLIAGILVVLSLVSIVPHELDRATNAGNDPSPLPLVAGAPEGPKRDVWYLIFDRYSSDEQLKAAFGIDGTLDSWLTDKGFYVAPDSQANYVKTSLSMASSLNLDYLDDIVARMGPDSDDHGPVFAALQDHVLGRFLQSQGYRFIQVGSPYGPTNVNPYADENPRLGSTSDFAAAVYETSVVPAIGRRIGLVRSTPLRERSYETARFQWETLQGLVDDPGPKLVISHFLLPHPPYVFDRDGSFVSEEDDDGDVAAGYARQLAYTDAKIKELVERLQALPEDRRPIVVLQADEGPYPERYNDDTVNFDWASATEAELRMKYGILNAYFLPGQDPKATGLHPGITPVNSFRLILGRYFGTDTPLLPDREFTSKGKFRPYDLTEVTDRLARP